MMSSGAPTRHVCARQVGTSEAVEEEESSVYVSCLKDWHCPTQDLVQAHERTMLLVSVCNGIPSLLIYTLQRPSLHQWVRTQSLSCYGF